MTEIESLIEQAQQVLARLPVPEPVIMLYIEVLYIDRYGNQEGRGKG